MIVHQNIFIEKYSKIKQPQTEIEKSYTKVFEDAYNNSKEKKFNMTTKLKEINSTEDFQIIKNLSNISQEERDHIVKYIELKESVMESTTLLKK